MAEIKRVSAAPTSFARGAKCNSLHKLSNCDLFWKSRVWLETLDWQGFQAIPMEMGGLVMQGLVPFRNGFFGITSVIFSPGGRRSKMDSTI